MHPEPLDRTVCVAWACAHARSGTGLGHGEGGSCSLSDAHGNQGAPRSLPDTRRNWRGSLLTHAGGGSVATSADLTGRSLGAAAFGREAPEGLYLGLRQHLGQLEHGRHVLVKGYGGEPVFVETARLGSSTSAGHLSRCYHLQQMLSGLNACGSGRDGECSALEVGDLRVFEHSSDALATFGTKAVAVKTAMGAREVSRVSSGKLHVTDSVSEEVGVQRT